VCYKENKKNEKTKLKNVKKCEERERMWKFHMEDIKRGLN